MIPHARSEIEQLRELIRTLPVADQRDVLNDLTDLVDDELAKLPDRQAWEEIVAAAIAGEDASVPVRDRRVPRGRKRGHLLGRILDSPGGQAWILWAITTPVGYWPDPFDEALVEIVRTLEPAPCR